MLTVSGNQPDFSSYSTIPTVAYAAAQREYKPYETMANTLDSLAQEGLSGYEGWAQRNAWTDALNAAQTAQQASTISDANGNPLSESDWDAYVKDNSDYADIPYRNYLYYHSIYNYNNRK